MTARAPEWPASLARRFGWARTCRWLGSGTSRASWAVTLPDRVLVWRIPHTKRPSGSDRLREEQILQSLADWPEVPDLVWSDETGQSLLSYAPGNAAGEVVWRGDLRRTLLALLDRLWTQPGPGKPWDYGELVERYADQAGTDRAKRLAERLQDALVFWPPVSPVLTHHDLQAGNVLADSASGRVWLLDWEYAAPGNPWLDAVTLAEWCPLSAAERSWLTTRLIDWLPTHGDNPFVFYGAWMEHLALLWAEASGVRMPPGLAPR